MFAQFRVETEASALRALRQLQRSNADNSGSQGNLSMSLGELDVSCDLNYTFEAPSLATHALTELHDDIENNIQETVQLEEKAHRHMANNQLLHRLMTAIIHHRRSIIADSFKRLSVAFKLRKRSEYGLRVFVLFRVWRWKRLDVLKKQMHLMVFRRWLVLLRRRRLLAVKYDLSRFSIRARNDMRLQQHFLGVWRRQCETWSKCHGMSQLIDSYHELSASFMAWRRKTRFSILKRKSSDMAVRFQLKVYMHSWQIVYQDKEKLHDRLTLFTLNEKAVVFQIMRRLFLIKLTCQTLVQVKTSYLTRRIFAAWKRTAFAFRFRERHVKCIAFRAFKHSIQLRTERHDLLLNWEQEIYQRPTFKAIRLCLRNRTFASRQQVTIRPELYFKLWRKARNENLNLNEHAVQRCDSNNLLIYFYYWRVIKSSLVARLKALAEKRSRRLSRVYFGEFLFHFKSRLQDNQISQQNSLMNVHKSIMDSWRRRLHESRLSRFRLHIHSDSSREYLRKWRMQLYRNLFVAMKHCATLTLSFVAIKQVYSSRLETAKSWRERMNIKCHFKVWKFTFFRSKLIRSRLESALMNHHKHISADTLTYWRQRISDRRLIHMENHFIKRADSKQSRLLFIFWRVLQRSLVVENYKNRRKLQLFLATWNHQTALRLLENVFSERSAFHAKRKYFNHFLHISASVISKRQLDYDTAVQHSDETILGKRVSSWYAAYSMIFKMNMTACCQENRHLLLFINRWKAKRLMLALARDFHKQHRVANMLATWKSLANYDKNELIKANRFLRKSYMYSIFARLTAYVVALSKSHNDFRRRTTRVLFERWRGRKNSLQNHAKPLNETFLKRKTFNTWYSVYAARRANKEVSADLYHRKSIIGSALHLWKMRNFVASVQRQQATLFYIKMFLLKWKNQYLYVGLLRMLKLEKHLLAKRIILSKWKQVQTNSVHLRHRNLVFNANRYLKLFPSNLKAVSRLRESRSSRVYQLSVTSKFQSLCTERSFFTLWKSKFYKKQMISNLMRKSDRIMLQSAFSTWKTGITPPKLSSLLRGFLSKTKAESLRTWRTSAKRKVFIKKRQFDTFLLKLWRKKLKLVSTRSMLAMAVRKYRHRKTIFRAWRKIQVKIYRLTYM